MIAKAAVLIQQLNNLITDLESQEDKELDDLKKQLDAVNRAISTLKTNDLSIPQDLTDTQERLKADVLDRDEVSVVLAFLKDELKKISDRVRRLENTQRSAQTASLRSVRAGTRTIKGSYVSKDTLRRTLIESLKTFGGSARKIEVEDEMERRLRGILTDADYELVGEGIPRWRKKCRVDEVPFSPRRHTESKLPTRHMGVKIKDEMTYLFSIRFGFLKDILQLSFKVFRIA